MCAGWNQSTNYKCCSEYEFTGEESEEIGPDSDSVTDQMRNLGQLTSTMKGMT